jgi:hypothetical protein
VTFVTPPLLFEIINSVIGRRGQAYRSRVKFFRLLLVPPYRKLLLNHIPAVPPTTIRKRRREREKKKPISNVQRIQAGGNYERGRGGGGNLLAFPSK